MASPLLPAWRHLWTAAPFQLNYSSKSKSKSKSKLCYDRRSVSQSVLVSSTHLRLTTRFLLLSGSCGFVDAGRSLWRDFPFRRLLRLVGLWWIELYLLQLSSLQSLCTDRVENTLSNSTSIVACVSVAAGTCLQSSCLETAIHATVLRLTSSFNHVNQFYLLVPR
jgi:hypothetical protein